MNIPIYKAIIDEKSGMTCLSLVSSPAVEQDFLCFESDQIVKFDKDKQFITGVVMLADSPIYRRSEKMGEYYLIFDKDQIKVMVEKWLADGYFKNFSTQHDGTPIDGLTLLETYFVDEHKPSPFKVPEGSVVMTFRCTNDDVWKRIESGELKGFSLEAMLAVEPEEFKEETKEPEEQSYEEWIDELLK